MYCRDTEYAPQCIMTVLYRGMCHVMRIVTYREFLANIPPPSHLVAVVGVGHANAAVVAWAVLDHIAVTAPEAG